VLTSTLLFGVVAPTLAKAGPVTLKDFVLTNTSATTANDLAVTFTQPISTIQSNELLNGPGTSPARM
jgi:hypothetical protein